MCVVLQFIPMFKRFMRFIDQRACDNPSILPCMTNYIFLPVHSKLYVSTLPFHHVLQMMCFTRPCHHVLSVVYISHPFRHVCQCYVSTRPFRHVYFSVEHELCVDKVGFFLHHVYCVAQVCITCNVLLQGLCVYHD